MKEFLFILPVVFILLGVGCNAPVNNPQVPVACTQEAKICPDGSSVGRTGPNCEFAPCPAPKAENAVCNTTADCTDGATCMVEGPLIANQPVRKVCVPKGHVVPLNAVK